MNKLAKRAWFTMVLVGVLIVGLVAVSVRYVIDADQWAGFLNSPYVYHQKGFRNREVVTDCAGNILLQSDGGKSYADNATTRRAFLHLLGDRGGSVSAPVLSEYGDELLGYNRIMGMAAVGGGEGTMRLTVSAAAQTAALNALGGYKGTIGVYNYKTGEILCMVSTPTFDPENAPGYDEIEASDAYEGVYLNRFTQSTYLPGSTFKLVTAAAALKYIDNIEDRQFTCTGSVEIAGETVTCNGVHGTIDIKQALCHSCNVAFAEIAVELGEDRLQAFAGDIGITEPLTFDGITTATGKFDLSDVTDYTLGWAGIGQYTDLINPCRYMYYMGAIANGGEAATPYLVSEVSFNEKSQYSAKTKTDEVLDKAVANALAKMMHYAVENNYGSWNFCGVYAGAKSGTAERGEGQTATALMSGFLQDEAYPLAFIAVVEGGGSGSSACTPILNQVLSACITAMDAQ